jgi:Tfp pilus assembly protein PilW
MNTRTPTRPMGAQRGFGLVELMISLVLGMIVVGGALVLLLSTRQATGNTENLSRVQDSVRTSFEMMTREVREAGATPCDSKGLVSNVLNNAQGAQPHLVGHLERARDDAEPALWALMAPPPSPVRPSAPRSRNVSTAPTP